MNKYVELIRNTGIIAIGKMSVQILNVLLLPIYTKYLSTEEYGQADLILTYVTLFLPIISLQVEQALFREMTISRNDKYKQETIVSTILTATYALSFIIAMGGIGVSFFTRSIYGFFFTIIVIASLNFNMYMYYARGIGDNSAYSLGSFIDMIVMILLNILLIGVIKIGIIGMLISNFAGYIVASIVLIYRLHIFRTISLSHVKVKELPEYLKYSIPMIPNALSWWILSASDKLVVKTFIGLSASGILAIAHKFGNIYQTIFHMFLLAWQESATLHKDDENAERFFSVVFNHIVRIFGTLGLVILFATPFAFNLLIDNKYSNALNIVPLYVFSVFIGIIVGFLSGIYVAYGDSKSISWATIIGALLNIGINVLLVSLIGIYASPISTIMSNVVIALWRVIDSRKYIKIHIKYDELFLILILFLALIVVFFTKNRFWRIIVELIVAVCIVFINRHTLNLILHRGKEILDERNS